MADGSGSSIGARIAEVRARRKLTLRTAGELAGFSASYLSLIERGERPVDKRSTLEAIATALRVAPGDLLGAPYASTDAVTGEANAVVTALRQALGEIELADAPQIDARPMPDVRPGLARVNALRQACDFASLGRTLPTVIRDLHAHAHSSSDRDRREALLGLVQCYEAGRAASKHLGVPDLSYVAARHVRDVTTALSGPEWAGLAAWSRAQAIGSTSRERALELSRATAEEIAGDLDRAPVAEAYGSLHLVAALAATTLGRPADADEHLQEASEVAARIGDDGVNFGHLWFTASNVETWRVMVLVERGEGGRAGEVARAVNPATLPDSGERRAAFWLDLGRGLATEKRTRDAAVAALRTADAFAPQRVRLNPYVRETVRDLAQRVKRDAVGEDLRELAFRMGVAA